MGGLGFGEQETRVLVVGNTRGKNRELENGKEDDDDGDGEDEEGSAKKGKAEIAI